MKYSAKHIVGKQPRKVLRSPMRGGSIEVILARLRTIQPYVFSRMNSASLQGGATYFSKLADPSGFQTTAALRDSISLENIIQYVRENPISEAQKNGAINELRNYLLRKNSSLTVSEQTNSALAILGLPAEFSKIAVSKIPELQQVISSSGVSTTISPVTDEERSETPDPETITSMVTAITNFPKPIAEVPVSTQVLQKATETVSALLPKQETAAIVSNVVQNTNLSTTRQKLVYFLLASIPFLLNSLLYESKTLGLVLLMLYFGLMYADPTLATDMQFVLESLAKK